MYQTPVTLTFDLGNMAAHWQSPTFYNPSITFDSEGGACMAVRVEERSNELSSVLFFKPSTIATKWTLIPDAPRFELTQDPYYLGTFTNPTNTNQIYRIIGMVKVTVDHITGHITDWCDTYYNFTTSIHELDPTKPLFAGVSHHKDTRFTQLANGRIGVCPRPQGMQFGGLGKIGYFETANLQSLEADLHTYIVQADTSTLIEGIVSDDEWGGVNQMLPQADGSIVLIGHKARRIKQSDESIARQYRPFIAHFDPRTRCIIRAVNYPSITPAIFDPVIPKQPDLSDVLFTSGLMFPDGADAEYCRIRFGNGDAAVCEASIPNPIRFV